MRQKYDLGMFDAEDKLSANNMAGMEEFFKQTFGGDAFFDLIGEISLARLIDDMMGAAMEKEQQQKNSDASDPGSKSSSTPSMTNNERNEANSKFQEDRITMLHEKLLRKIEPFMEGSETEEQLRERVSNEIKDLKKESFGTELLHSIGYVYITRSSQIISKDKYFGMSSFFEGLKEKGHMVSEFVSTISAIRQMMKVMEAEQKASVANDQAVPADHEKNEAIMKKALWKASNLDIESTLREVCFRAIQSKTVPSEIRKKRAIAINIIGQVFQSA